MDVAFPPHSFSYVVTASSPNMIIAVSTTAASPDQQVAVDDVTLEEIHDVASMDRSSEPAVRSSSVFLPEWSVVQTSWHFVDDVSPIVDYQWALGESAVTACFLCSYSCHWCLCPYGCHVCVHTAVTGDCAYTTVVSVHTAVTRVSVHTAATGVCNTAIVSVSIQ